MSPSQHTDPERGCELIVGGIVFRVVTPNCPGCPKLDAEGAPSIRTEYLATEFEPAEWSTLRSEAFFFRTHRDAEIRAKAIGERCHALVATPPDQEPIPERLTPLPALKVLPPPLAYPSKKKHRKGRVAPPAPAVNQQRPDWVKQTYG